MRSLDILYTLSISHLIILAQGVGTRTQTKIAPKQSHTTQAVTSGPRVMEDFITRTIEDYRQAGAVRNTRARDGQLKDKKHTRKKVSSSNKRQLRMVDFPVDPCSRWKPSLNATTDPATGSIVVDYCLTQTFPVPSTYTWVTKIKTNLTVWTLIEKPWCNHTFGNLTAGNYTIYIKAICERCFKTLIDGSACPSAYFTRTITLGVSTTPGQSTEVHITPGQSTEVSPVEHKNTGETPVVIIIVASCSTIFVVGVLLLAAFVKRYYIKRPSSTSGTTCSEEGSFHQLQLMSVDQSTGTQTYSHSSSSSDQETETSFIHAEEQTTTDRAFLASAQRQNMEYDQQTIVTEYQSYPLLHENITESEPASLAMSVSSDRNSTFDSPGSSLQKHHSPGSSLQKHHNDIHSTDAGCPDCGNCEDTFPRTNPRRSRKIFDIPYHLILDNNS